MIACSLSLTPADAPTVDRDIHSSESPKRHSFEKMSGGERSPEQIRIAFALSQILSHSFTQKKFFFVHLTRQASIAGDAVRKPATNW